VAHDVIIDHGTASGGIQPDLKVDSVTIDGTDGADVLRVRNGGDFHEISGLPARLAPQRGAR
jgi:hypothetical protein